MARLPRVAIPGLPHHVTQRGNARQPVFAHDSDRATYLHLLRQYCDLYQVALLGYCLMSNHVHLIAVPRTTTALADALRHTHGRYAAYWNARLATSGHVWQGRFYSCPFDESHLWEALRYVELNPVRARMVADAAQWKWSSAAAHCVGVHDGCLDTTRWQARWSATSWREYLAAGEPETAIDALRRSTHTGRPLGTPDFIAALEKSTSRLLALRKGGRPARPAAPASRQSKLAFITCRETECSSPVCHRIIRQNWGHFASCFASRASAFIGICWEGGRPLRRRVYLPSFEFLLIHQRTMNKASKERTTAHIAGAHTRFARIAVTRAETPRTMAIKNPKTAPMRVRNPRS